MKNFQLYRISEDYLNLKKSNSEISLITIPLVFAMTINVCFVLGAVFIPNLWSIVEYLFPLALSGFITVGYFAIKIFLEFFTRIFANSEFDCQNNNSFSQMISIFAFTMIGVGFSAPAAMSTYHVINAISFFGAIFFMSLAFLLLLLNFVMGVRSIFKYGINKEASPSIWILIPILTLIGITFVRLLFGLKHHFDVSLHPITFFILTSIIFSLQIIFGLIGFGVMKKIEYFQNFIQSDKKSAMSFALICPGVALMVFGMFFIHQGLVFPGLITKFSLLYFLFLIPFIYVQYKTVIYFFILKKKFF